MALKKKVAFSSVFNFNYFSFSMYVHILNPLYGNLYNFSTGLLCNVMQSTASLMSAF